ncbi:family 78 glycoside hydrolase catalytic domain [Streptomyces sp. NPDC102264]|uniref:family 78 glycoside hydrolase catalytic domain n=1 Tax=Streptomyces sp. NPDC102264 TaxID=3366149 RepID=UPI00380E78DA
MTEDWNRRKLLRTTVIAVAATAVGQATLGATPAGALDHDGDHDHDGRQAPLRVQRTSVEYAENLLGTDIDKPRLSWELSAEGRRGAAQTAYQIRTARSVSDLHSGRRLVWDSGRVASDRSIQVAYAGPELQPRTRYYWQVRVWDERGRPSSWSPVRWWETALPDDGWKGHWIGFTVPAPKFDGASWIWSADATANAAPQGPRWFRGTFTLPEGARVAKATLMATADDDFTLYVDGERVLHADQRSDGWREGKVIDIAQRVQAGGSFTFAAVATNRGDNPAGLLVRLLMEDGAGSQVAEFVTDGTWRVSSREEQGWTQAEFDDSAWGRANSVAPYGDGPWGRGAGFPPTPEGPAPLLRRDFTVSKRVAQARLYISGVAYYEAEINGRRVGRQVLDPAITNYEATVLYAVHDVTDAVERGQNAIGVTLGRGFYGIKTPNAWGWGNAAWHGEPRLLAQLEIRHTDGTTTTVATDESWRLTAGPTRSNSLYAGETYDARSAPADWTRPGFDDRDWWPAPKQESPRGTLRPQALEPIEVVETVHPTEVKDVGDGVYLVDMGRTMAGWCRLAVTAAAGTKVALVHSEKLDGRGRVIDASGFTPGRFQRDEYVCAGTGRTEVWEPKFSYKGFRYVEVSGLSEAPKPGQVLGRLVHSAVDEASDFACSEGFYEQLDKAMRRTLANNLHGIPTDTPKYEKNGWTGDANVAVPSMLYTFGLQRFFSKWLNDIKDSQEASGRIPSIVPSPGWGYNEYNPAPEWTTVYPLLLHQMHRTYGDERLVREHWASVVRYLDWELGRRTNGLVSSVIGDYLSPGHIEPPEDATLTASAYLHRSLLAVADLSGVAGEKDEGERLRAAAEEIKTALNRTFLTSAGHYRTSRDRNYRQTSNVIPLAFGLVPNAAVPGVVASLVQNITSPPPQGDPTTRSPNTLNTGVLGTSVLLPQLTAHGHADLAHKVATQRAYPSWGYWFENGADTMWEYWRVPENRSHNHYFKGTVVQWLYENVAGLRPGSDGYRTFAVKPDARVGVSWARTSLRTVRGEVSVAWATADGTFRLRVKVPVGSTAEVHVPAPDKAEVTAHEEAGKIRLDNGFVVYKVPQGYWEFTSRA